MHPRTLGKDRPVADDALGRHLFDLEDNVIQAVAFEVIGDDATKYDVDKCLAPTLMWLGVKGDGRS
jgi:hypothetical protein